MPALLPFRPTAAWLVTGLLLTGLAPQRAAAQGGVTVDTTKESKSFYQETPAQKNERMAWWRDAKFGLFLHWGIYSVPAGRYAGKDHYGEWIMNQGRVPVADYRAWARQFNPVRYEPARWAKLAKAAGMRYVVITAKHHDGFALYPSAVTDWDVADATPYGKDLLGPLVEAARGEGLKIGFYYSQAQDWMHPGGGKAGGFKEGGGWDEAHKGRFDDYLAKIAVPQVRELLTAYHPDILWWDTPTWMTVARAQPLADLIPLRPGMILNNRLGGGYKGDTETPEQFVPLTAIQGDWETCMTMNDHWGYNAADQNWKPAAELIRKLADICSKGGNFLLNVGPTSEGLFPQPSIDRLTEIGRWLAVNGEAIYGTTAGPFLQLSWGCATRKGDRLYLHVFQWPQDGKLRVPLQSRVAGGHLLGAPQIPLTVTQETDRVIVDVPPVAPDPVDTVVVLELAGEPIATPLASAGKPVTASSAKPGHGPENAVDGTMGRTWIAADQQQTATLEVDLLKPTALTGFGLGELDAWPRLKQDYKLAVENDGSWKNVAEGQTNGHGLKRNLEGVTARRVRLSLQVAKGIPGLAEFQLYRAE